MPNMPRLVRYTLLTLPVVLVFFLVTPEGAWAFVCIWAPGTDQASTLGVCFDDEFNGSELNLGKWDVFKGNPTVSEGELVLSGGNTTAEIQSKQELLYGVLQMVITSSSWKPQAEVTDSSFGLEHFKGTNGQCHYAVLFMANGHLGLLRSEPVEDDNCFGDPKYQAFIPISNWDAVRAKGTVIVTLTWAPNSVMLHVNDGSANSGDASYPGIALPATSLKIRLNADVNENYSIDYGRLIGIPWR
jgi:hypothetical protein